MSGSERMDSVRIALIKLHREKGELTPRLVVDEAKKKTEIGKALHSYFNWDDANAADNFRLEQARKLIRYVTISVIHETAEYNPPTFVRDPNKEPTEQGFVQLAGNDKLRKDDARAILLSELDRCRSSLQRALNISVVLEKKFPWLVHELNDQMDQLEEIREKLNSA